MRYTHLLVMLLVSASSTLTLAAKQQKWSIQGTADATAHFGNAQQSWLSEEAMGKHRAGDDDTSTILQGALALQYKPSLQSGFSVEAAYYPDPNDKIGITQAFWHYKTLSTKHWSSQYRLGAFHIPISLENPGPLWQSRYTITPSMINTWAGEELRIIGAQGSWSWRPSPISRHKISFSTAAFGANDSAGVMLAWRGWASHNRQALLGETIGMQALPVTQPGAPFEKQAQEFEPFVEVDDRAGYFVNVGWRYDRKINISYLYYDNRGDPLALEDNQYAWDTRFHHLGLQAKLTNNWTLISQATVGNTLMGPGAVDNDFMSAFILLSKKIDRHRFTARAEIFDIDDLDFLPEVDPNDEDGYRLTLGYRFKFDDNWNVAAEASRLQSNRKYREVFGQSKKLRENQFLLKIQYKF